MLSKYTPSPRMVVSGLPVTSMHTMILALLALALPQGQLRIDQLGYRPLDSKIALLMTDVDQSSKSFSITRVASLNRLGGRLSQSLPVGADRGAYGKFAHVYELDFSSVTRPGSYRVGLRGAGSSETFEIGAGVYDSVIPTALKFFLVQRCGDTDPQQHGVCHVNPGIAVGGPVAGSLVPNAGGWHDAGDYLKFLGEESSTALLMLEGFLHAPAKFEDADGNGIPEVLEEARIGLEWFQVMWDSSNDVLYHQVSKGSDDHYPWRLPEVDDSDPDPAKSMRKTFACQPGKGANFAGRTSAALALGARIFGDVNASYHDAAFAVSCQVAAEELYVYGTGRPQVQNPPGGGFEGSWKDDIGLAAVELYSLTGTSSYLSDAQTLVPAAGNAFYFNSIALNAMAHYRLAQVDPAYLASAVSALRTDALFVYAFNAAPNTFRETLDVMQWGSLTEICGRGLEILMYEELSGDTQLHALAMDQWHYNFGLNAFGVSFVNGLGKRWSSHPHHQVVDPSLNPSTTGLLGFWNEGPADVQQYAPQGIVLGTPDAYKLFQTSFAVYHDDIEDYVTNEPTVIGNGMGIAFAAWL